MDLTGANLTGLDLTGANLTDANLEGANLTNAILTDADLTVTDLTGAVLTGAVLQGTDLEEADLTGAILTGANLTNANLEDAVLTGVNLTGANLTGAILTGANLTNANLTDTDLTDTDLTDAILTGVNLTGANLTNANLADTDLTDAILTGVIGMVIPEPERVNGEAFEIHNQFKFDFDFNKFMEIIRTYNTEHSANESAPSPASPNLKPDEAEPNLGEDLRDRQITQRLLKPLIDYPGYTQKRNVLKQLNIAYEDRDEDAVQDTIAFVLLQSPNFIKAYIDTFTTDCVNAYKNGRRTSCIKGQYERVFTNVKETIQIRCLDINNKLKESCKEVYKDLYGCFLPDDTDAIMNEWWDSQTDADDYPIDGTEPEKMVFINKKSAEFKQHFIDKFSKKFAGAINKYITKTFTIAYFDLAFEKLEPAVQLEPQVNIKCNGEVYNFKITDTTTIGELKGMLLDKLVEEGKNPDVNYTVRFIFSGKIYPNEKNGELVSVVINKNYEAVLLATIKSNIGMGRTRKQKRTKKISGKKISGKKKNRTKITSKKINKKMNRTKIIRKKNK